MKWPIWTLGLLGLLLGGCSGGDLKEYVSKEGRFRVLMPGEPTESTLPFGARMIHQAKLDQRGGSYTVAYEDVADAQTPEQLEKQLDQDRDGVLEQSHGKLHGEKRITLSGRHPGRELMIELEAVKQGVPAKEWVRQRLYRVDGRLYQVVAAGEKWWVESAQAEKFFDSFALLP